MRRNWLKEIRISKDLTQNQVAENARVERAYYTMIENGDRNPSVEVAKRISEALGFDWVIFFDHESNITTHKGEETPDLAKLISIKEPPDPAA